MANWIDGSGPIITDGTAQQVFAANYTRRYLLIQNISNTTMWFDIGVPAVQDQPSIQLRANELFIYDGPWCPDGSVSIICAIKARKFVAKQIVDTVYGKA